MQNIIDAIKEELEATPSVDGVLVFWFGKTETGRQLIVNENSTVDVRDIFLELEMVRTFLLKQSIKHTERRK